MDNWGLYIGRFQPLHNGHVYAIRYILSKVSNIIIAIGSAQHSYTLINPFTVGERIKMIWYFLKDEGLLDRCILTQVPDTEQHYIWASLVKQHSPKFSIAFSNDLFTRMLLEAEGYIVESIPYINREVLNATNIRRLIIEDGDWKSLVPGSTVKIIEEINGVERIKRLYALQNKA
ncbi:MAG: nicotinamide-nucleotide adenylyltransferase [Candidatus Methanomethylicia archaeon]